MRLRFLFISSFLQVCSGAWSSSTGLLFTEDTHRLLTYDGKMSGSSRRNGGKVKGSLQWGNSYKTEKKRGRMNELLCVPRSEGQRSASSTLSVRHLPCNAFLLVVLSPRFSRSRDTAGVTSRECEMPSDISQYHNVAPSFPLNEILDLQLPSKNSFLLSLLSLAKEQLCNPCQITFCCSGMQEGIWDSCSLNYCSL